MGGGPAGCMAALVAANRGHDVTLYEEGDRLGGAYGLAVPSPSKREVERFFTYFERALPKAGVDLKLETAFTAKSMDRQKLVSIVTEREDVVPGMGFTSRNYLMKRFYRANVRVCPDSKIKETKDQGLVIEKAGV